MCHDFMCAASIEEELVRYFEAATLKEECQKWQCAQGVFFE